MTIQALVESSMSLFLFLWPVTIAIVNRYQLDRCLRTMKAVFSSHCRNGEDPPLGRIFSTLMVSPLYAFQCYFLMLSFLSQ